MRSGELLFVLHWDQAQSFAVPALCASACDTKKSVLSMCQVFGQFFSLHGDYSGASTMARSSIARVSFRCEPTASFFHTIG